MPSPPKISVSPRAIARHSAVSFIQQGLTAGKTLRSSLKSASEICWEGTYYSPRTLEGWFYDYIAEGFAALQTPERSDKGSCRALSPAQCEAILSLRREHPKLTVTALVRQLAGQDKLHAGRFSIQSVYRLLQREGLDRRSLDIQPSWGGPGEPPAIHGPTKAFEHSFPNALWMSDVMDGPTLRLSTGARPTVRTWLFAVIDDHSRLVPHAMFYDNTKLINLLDLLAQAFDQRGLPDALYTDQGKIFTSTHLKLICANLNIRLLHAKPYAAWSKGKIERFFRTVQQSFLAELSFEHATNLSQLNERFGVWLEAHYHRRPHSALDGHTPIERFQTVRLRMMPEDWRPLFFERTDRRVRMDATITLNARLYEVPVHLRGRKVELRIDPFTAGNIEVWFGGKQCGLARPCNKQHNNSYGNLYDSHRSNPDEF